METLARRCRCRRPDQSEVMVLVYFDPDRRPESRAAFENGAPVDWVSRAEFRDPATGERLEIIEKSEA